MNKIQKIRQIKIAVRFIGFQCFSILVPNPPPRNPGRAIGITAWQTRKGKTLKKDALVTITIPA
ncbi:MAG: hypothetical protein EA359_13985 [Balneolaceae bacterium]|nr:MAG: hypothetical protein EA359_13985 [Balneolaceae bacterium]